jgi:inorganic pyrophosphatase
LCGAAAGLPANFRRRHPLDPGIRTKEKHMGAHDAVIEIPRGSRVKYEVDHETGRVHLDRVLYTTFGYPADYGYFDNTLGEDGDPLDVLVLLDHAIYPGVVVNVRPVAVLKMSDEAGGDDKLVAVLSKDPRWSHIQDVDDLAEYTKKEIAHFFEHYKDLEPNKWVKVDEWGNAAEAQRILDEAIARFGAEGH